MGNIFFDFELVKTVEVDGERRFSVSEKLTEVGVVEGVRIIGAGALFQEIFLGKVERIEMNVAPATLKIRRPLRNVSDNLISRITHKETMISSFWKLLKKQGFGEDGDLLVNGLANIIPVRVGSNRLIMVGARWCANKKRDEGWFFGASFIGKGVWPPGVQIISR